jgi:hypothetical protein
MSGCEAKDARVRFAVHDVGACVHRFRNASDRFVSVQRGARGSRGTSVLVPRALREAPPKRVVFC